MTVTDLAALAVTLLTFFALVVILRLAYRRKRAVVATVHETPVDVLIVRNAIREWLHVRRIVDAIVGTQTASRAELDATYRLLPAMSSQQLQSTAAALLQNGRVRRVVASWFVQHYQGRGITLHGVERELLVWAGKDPQRTLESVLEMAEPRSPGERRSA